MLNSSQYGQRQQVRRLAGVAEQLSDIVDLLTADDRNMALLADDCAGHEISARDLAEMEAVIDAAFARVDRRHAEPVAAARTFETRYTTLWQ